VKNAAQILKDYCRNRFAKPSSVDPIQFAEINLLLLKLANNEGFEILEFSPLSPLGTSSIHKTINQNNIVSALRRVEVVSDITNVMALEISKRIKENSSIDKIDLAASHRLTRGQGFDNREYTAHFKVIGMVSSWKDKGKFKGEEDALIKHITTYVKMFKDVYQIPIKELELNLNVLSNIDNIDFNKFVERVSNCIEGLSVNVVLIENSNNYYSNIKFGIKLKSMDYPIIDGGFVNWVSTFTQNKKRRLLISGIGTELMYKMHFKPD